MLKTESCKFYVGTLGFSCQWTSSQREEAVILDYHGDLGLLLRSGHGEEYIWLWTEFCTLPHPANAYVEAIIPQCDCIWRNGLQEEMKVK